MDPILLQIISILCSGGFCSAITYFITLKSIKKKANAEAEATEVEVQLKKQDLKQDLCDYLLNTCDKYIKDYHLLEGDFRKEVQELREQLDKIMLEKSLAISDKCNEIAGLKSKITYLKGIRCYNFTCQHRMCVNPTKKEE